MAIHPANPTALQLLIRRLVEAGIDLDPLPSVGPAGVIQVSIRESGDLARLHGELDRFGYHVVASDDRTTSVLLTASP